MRVETRAAGASRVGRGGFKPSLLSLRVSLDKTLSLAASVLRGPTSASALTGMARPKNPSPETGTPPAWGASPSGGPKIRS